MTLYIIRAGDDGPVKIGYASDPRKRFSNLQIASPVPLQFLGVKTGDKTAERALHKRFLGLHLHGEWFTFAPEMLEGFEPLPMGPIRRRPLFRASPVPPVKRSGEPNPLCMGLVRLAQLYSDAVGLAVATVATRVAKDSKFFRRLEQGCDVTTTKYERVRSWFSIHWPDGIEWPADVKRPAIEEAA